IMRMGRMGAMLQMMDPLTLLLLRMATNELMVMRGESEPLRGSSVSLGLGNGGRSATF
ncbi:hypothetical protein A2U01_0066945, partial [Trifolium medium]|nr:hypothetical protein [Trifolium medium]